MERRASEAPCQGHHRDRPGCRAPGAGRSTGASVWSSARRLGDPDSSPWGRSDRSAGVPARSSARRISSPDPGPRSRRPPNRIPSNTGASLRSGAAGTGSPSCAAPKRRARGPMARHEHPAGAQPGWRLRPCHGRTRRPPRRKLACRDRGPHALPQCFHQPLRDGGRGG